MISVRGNINLGLDVLGEKWEKVFDYFSTATHIKNIPVAGTFDPKRVFFITIL